MTRRRRTGCPPGTQLWTPAEDALILRDWPRRARRAGVCQKLAHRTRQAIVQRAHQLQAPSPGRDWTAAENAILRLHWQDLLPRALRAKLPGRSWRAIHRQATQRLGLPAATQGTVTMKDAAARAGLARATLQKMLRAAGVPLHRMYSARGPRSRSWWAVALDDVDRVLADWNATETICGAARARGISTMQLWHWMDRAGLLAGPRHRGLPRRFPTKVFDQVVAAHRKARAS